MPNNPLACGSCPVRDRAACAALSEEERAEHTRERTWGKVSGVGPKTATVISQAVAGEVPEYLQLETKAFKGTFVRAPQLAEVPYPVVMHPNLVVEFYSR